MRAFPALPGLIGFVRNKSLMVFLSSPVPRSQLDRYKAGFSHLSKQQNGSRVNLLGPLCVQRASKRAGMGILGSQDRGNGFKLREERFRWDMRGKLLAVMMVKHMEVVAQHQSWSNLAQRNVLEQKGLECPFPPKPFCGFMIKKRPKNHQFPTSVSIFYDYTQYLVFVINVLLE